VHDRFDRRAEHLHAGADAVVRLDARLDLAVRAAVVKNRDLAGAIRGGCAPTRLPITAPPGGPATVPKAAWFA
jgi:hypothetical protein